MFFLWMQALPTPLKNFQKNQIIVQIRSKWLNFQTLYTVMVSVIKVSDGGIHQLIHFHYRSQQHYKREGNWLELAVAMWEIRNGWSFFWSGKVFNEWSLVFSVKYLPQLSIIDGKGVTEGGNGHQRLLAISVENLRHFFYQIRLQVWMVRTWLAASWTSQLQCLLILTRRLVHRPYGFMNLQAPRRKISSSGIM